MPSSRVAPSSPDHAGQTFRAVDRPTLPAPGGGRYDAICATMMESARGRWFLDEYARRNRNADTAMVLAAIERLEGRSAATRAAVLPDLPRPAPRHGQGDHPTRAEVAATAPPAQVWPSPTDPLRRPTTRRQLPPVRRCWPPPSASPTSPGPCASAASIPRPATRSRRSPPRSSPRPSCARPTTSARSSSARCWSISSGGSTA